MNYINQICKEIDEANAAMYRYVAEKTFEEKKEMTEQRLLEYTTQVQLVLDQIQAANRLKMKLESHFAYKVPFTLDEIKDLPFLMTENL